MQYKYKLSAFMSFPRCLLKTNVMEFENTRQYVIFEEFSSTFETLEFPLVLIQLCGDVVKISVTAPP
jgi:hypothetical protein